MEFRKKQQNYKLRREHCTLHTQHNSTPTRHPHDLTRENFLESIDISFWRQPAHVFDNTIGQSNNAVSILGLPLAGNERSSVLMLLSSGGWNIQRTRTETVFQGHTKIDLKQIDSMLPCVWFSYRSQKTSKCGKNISDTLGYASHATFFVLTTFWRHLWSITEQTHGNMESIC